MINAGGYDLLLNNQILRNALMYVLRYKNPKYKILFLNVYATFLSQAMRGYCCRLICQFERKQFSFNVCMRDFLEKRNLISRLLRITQR